MPKGEKKDFVTPLIGLIGVAVGGAATYLTTSEAALYSKQLEMQRSAYEDFAKAQAVWIHQDPNKASESTRLALRDASTRIAIFAPADVVRAVARYTRESEKRRACSPLESDVAMYQSIRQGIGVAGSEPVSNNDLVMVIFGCESQEAGSQ